MASLTTFGPQEQARFMDQGYLRLGKLLSDEGLAVLQQRIDDIMLGNVPYEKMRFQLDSDTGVYSDAPLESVGHKGRTLTYRKIMDLEQDPLFLAYMQHRLFRDITRRYIGEGVSIFRAMFMNKPAHRGTVLPWHQDVGKGWGLDGNPMITVWTALDDATVANGCMQIVPGSHQLGILNERHFVSEADFAKHALEEKVTYLEAEAGEAILLHNLLLHRSGVNHTSQSRRAFSSAYMDAATRSVSTGQTFPVIFGENALKPGNG
ncbi:phytanoyl-CoA dioxygenase family protein [Candidatus Poribacteria bacterium]|nr:phytanoyl-CoA dioxygenase family protein [Candidatus Poribacteria bacterium]